MDFLMNKDAENLVKLIKNNFIPEESNLKKITNDFNNFYLSFSSEGPLKILKEKDAPAESYWIVTPKSSHEKLILFFHGGGFNMGSTHGHQDLCQMLSKYTGLSVFSVDYQLDEENIFPAAVEDCLQSYLWLLEEGFQGKDIVMAGISFGGNLTLSSILALKKKGSDLPFCAVCMSPVVDLTFPVVYNHLKDVKDWIGHEQLDKFRKLYLKDMDPKNSLASPIYGDLEGFPPLMLQAGSKELLLCDINRFRDLAVEKEVKVNLEVWQDMFHCWHMFNSHLPSSEASIRSIGEFIKTLRKNQPK